jgi:hypothetical protein
VLLIEGQAAIVLNLKPYHAQVIQLLGPPYQVIYS